MNETWSASAAAASSAIIAGASIVATRFVVGQTDPLSLAFYRFALASLCFLPLVIVALREKAVNPRDLVVIAGLGTLFFGFFPWAFSASLNYTTAGRGAVGIATIPIATLLLSFVFGREHVSAQKVIGVLLAFFGVAIAFGDALISNKNAGDYLFGDALMLVAAFIAAIYTVFARPYLERYGPLVVTGLAMVLGALAIAMLKVSIGDLTDFPRFSASGWFAVLFLGIVGGAIQWGLYTWALRWISPVSVAVFATLAPISAVILANVILGEALTVGLILGLVLVIAAIFVANISTSVGRKGPH